MTSIRGSSNNNSERFTLSGAAASLEFVPTRNQAQWLERGAGRGANDQRARGIGQREEFGHFAWPVNWNLRSLSSWSSMAAQLGPARDIIARASRIAGAAWRWSLAVEAWLSLLQQLQRRLASRGALAL
jgi:hypothetical protein